MKQRIPVTIVTGFLGSGKTTLLRGLVQRRQSRRLALLINEFGEVSIDGALVRESADDEQVEIIELSHGLIAYGDDQRFLPAMRALAARRATVDHVLIETSGLALPTAVMELLQGPELADDFILDATFAVVDTPLLLSDQFEHGSCNGAAASLFEQQLEAADVVVLNKIDALDEDALLHAEARLRGRAPKVRFFELAHEGLLDIRLALGLRLHQPVLSGHGHSYQPVAAMPDPKASVLARHTLLNGHAHSGLAAHNHGLSTHKHFHEQDPGWLSFVLRSDAEQEPERFRAALAEALRAEPILRCKGFLAATGASREVLVQAVRTRVSVEMDRPKPRPRRSEMVFIGYHSSRSKVAAILSGATGTTWR
ncbi:GTP-binding protein [Oxalobacteraceae bacterium]|nr:GTP-binding protein [Oxalobacteraceae bacterium]